MCVLLAVALSAAAASAQPTQTNMVAGKEIVLGTKTPLGDAAITLPAGTTITNFEISGDKVLVRQGPFTARVSMAELQSEAEASPSPAATPAAAPAGQQNEAQPASAQAEPAVPAGDRAPPTASEPAAKAAALPEWVVPAVGGALVAYAAFVTVALLRSRRRPRRVSAHTAKNDAGKAPVVALPSKTTAKQAVVADGGRAIACPLCGKSIPMDKVAKGRNVCPTCRGAFVVE